MACLLASSSPWSFMDANLDGIDIGMALETVADVVHFISPCPTISILMDEGVDAYAFTVDKGFASLPYFRLTLTENEILVTAKETLQAPTGTIGCATYAVVSMGIVTCYGLIAVTMHTGPTIMASPLVGYGLANIDFISSLLVA